MDKCRIHILFNYKWNCSFAFFLHKRCNWNAITMYLFFLSTHFIIINFSVVSLVELFLSFIRFNGLSCFVLFFVIYFPNTYLYEWIELLLFNTQSFIQGEKFLVSYFDVFYRICVINIQSISVLFCEMKINCRYFLALW